MRVVVAVAATLAWTAALGAQRPAPPAPPPGPLAPPGPAGQCEMDVTANSDSTHFSSIKLPSGQYNNYVGGGVTGHCPAQSITLVSDSAEYFGELRMWHLIGHVHYTEPRVTLDSDLATYWMNDERLLSEGNVHAKLPSGTTLVGPRIDYLRPIAVVRPVSHMTAPGRPTISVIEHDSTGAPSDPMQVIANTVVMDGDSLVFASGQVEITRTDVIANSDSAFMDGQQQFAQLIGTPKITARGDRPFNLYGTVIDLFGKSRALDRVKAKGNAKGVSQDATLTADTLDFQMARGRLQRVYAWGKSRARALNPQYDIVSDSMDVRMPDQRMQEIRAVRSAFAQSTPDTTTIHTKERDWLRGDTVFAYFDSLSTAPPSDTSHAAKGTAQPDGKGSKSADTARAKGKPTAPASASKSAPAKTDTTRQPQLSSLVARGHAGSFYQVAARDTTATSPAVNYVRGREITVRLGNHSLKTVTVIDEVAGLYLEPRITTDSTRRLTDSTGAARDSTGRPRTPADSARARRPAAPPTAKP